MQLDLRREEFIEAAGELYSERGVANTSVGDIANRVGVTRSLFYHYFEDKQDITDAVFERCVDDFMERVYEWRGRAKGKILNDALLELAGLVRMCLFSPSSLGSHIMQERDADLYQRFVTRSAQRMAGLFVKGASDSGGFIHCTHVRHPRESLYVLAVGIMSMMLRRNDITDEIIADLIADTLNIDPSATYGRAESATIE